MQLQLPRKEYQNIRFVLERRGRTDGLKLVAARWRRSKPTGEMTSVITVHFYNFAELESRKKERNISTVFIMNACMNASKVQRSSRAQKASVAGATSSSLSVVGQE
jgi:hypothetical protein